MAAAAPTTRTKTLPSGRVATIRKGYGRDMMAAQRAARDVHEIPYALVATLVQIDGRPLVLEDVLDMELADVLELQSDVMGGSVPFSPPASTSSSSPSSPAGRSESSEISLSPS